MLIAIVMIHFGDVEVTRRNLTELRRKIGDNRLILLNNTAQDVRNLAGIIPRTSYIDNKTNIGFSRAVNKGITEAMKDKKIEAVLLMNNDLSLAFGSFAALVKTFNEKKYAGIVSPVLHHGGTLYDWGGKYNRWTGMVKHRNFEQKPKTVLHVDHVAGAAMLIRREVIEKIGLLDERFFLYYEDLDYCLRASRAGFTIHINPEAVAEHAVSAGSNAWKRTLYQWRSHIAFVIKHIPVSVYPTAFIIDFIFYPLVLIKAMLVR